MNKTKIEWTDYTWNPIVGCLNNCPYCYARKIAKRFYGDFKPRFYEERLREPYKLKKPSKIFVCSMGEMFGEWVSSDWIAKIFKVIRENPHHTFQILTKRPENPLLIIWKIPQNCWLGFTNTGADNRGMIKFYELPINNLKFVSYEPLLHRCDCSILKEINWIIIGAQTNPYKPPEKEWIKDILIQADRINIPVFMKNNLKPYWEGEFRQEFPLGGRS